MKLKLIISVFMLVVLTGMTAGSTETEAIAYAEGVASSSYWISSKLIGVNITCNPDDNWLIVSGIIESDDDEYLEYLMSDGAELAVRVTERYPSIEACSFIVFRPDGGKLVEMIVYN